MGDEVAKENERRKSMRRSKMIGSQAISEQAGHEEIELTKVNPDEKTVPIHK